MIEYTHSKMRRICKIISLNSIHLISNSHKQVQNANICQLGKLRRATANRLHHLGDKWVTPTLDGGDSTIHSLMAAEND